MGKSKELEIDGRKVTVTMETPEHGPHIIIRAECEGEVVEHSMTVGSTDGPGKEDYDVTRLQRDLDRERQNSAERAAWQAKAREMAKSVV